MTNFSQIENEAAQWLVREDRGLGLKERASFEQWLSQDTAHRVSYLRMKAAWHRADRLSTLSDSRPRPRPSLSRRFSMAFPVMVQGAAIAASVLVMIGLFAVELSPPQDNVIATAAGQHRDITLTDGTRIELNGDTSLRAKQSGAGRSVTLDHGLAYFEVVHDESHPFIVYAGNRKITDLGTKFSVYRNGSNVEIVVKEGRVRVDVLNETGSAISAQTDETLAAPDKVENAGKDNLQSGLLIFNDESLADVAREFNRNNKKQIHVAANARDIKIGGSFRVNNIDRFKVLLEQGFDVKVKENDGDIYVTK